MGTTSLTLRVTFSTGCYGSTMETVSQLCISLKRDYIARPDFERLTKTADDLARMLSGLRKSLQP